MLLALCLCLCAACFAEEAEAPDAAAFEAFMAANGIREMFTRHGNVRMTRTSFHEGKEVLVESCYRDAGMFMWNYGDGKALLRTADCFADLGFSGDGVYGRTIFDSPEACAEVYEQAQGEPFVCLLEGEMLADTYDTEDGLFAAVTKCVNPVVVRTALGETEYTGSYTYTDGMTLEYRYYFDRDTSDLVRTESYVVDAGGNAGLYQVETYDYGVEAYDPAREGEPFAAYCAMETAPEDMHTIRITYDPGTENEKTAEASLPAGFCFSVFRNGAYVTDLFLDPECTELYTAFEVTEDLDLYARTE